MSETQLIDELGGWEGYKAGCVGRFAAGERGPRPQVWIELHPVSSLHMTCDGCGQQVSKVHDVVERWVRDLPIWDAETHLLVWRRRVQCPRCGPKLERLPWLARFSRVTVRLAESVVRLCSVLPVKQVAQFFGLGWDQVKALDKTYLKRKLDPVDLSGVEMIAMDEFALHHGHRYATVVVEPNTRRVLWVGPGRGREDVRPFFDLLGEQGCRCLKAVVMDMSAPFAAEVKARCPNAEVVYDLFHVVAKFSREVIDRVRVDEANRLRLEPEARKVIKGSRWLLLRNRKNIDKREDRVRLSELLKANRALMTVYVLKEDLKHLWDYRYEGAAKRFWKEWYGRAMRSRIGRLKKFAYLLKRFLGGVLAHCRWPLHTSFLEGINNKIKVIKRMAYGFRDEEYFFLKIRAAFPADPG